MAPVLTFVCRSQMIITSFADSDEDYQIVYLLVTGRSCAKALPLRDKLQKYYGNVIRVHVHLDDHVPDK